MSTMVGNDQVLLSMAWNDQLVDNNQWIFKINHYRTTKSTMSKTGGCWWQQCQHWEVIIGNGYAICNTVHSSLSTYLSQVTVKYVRSNGFQSCKVSTMRLSVTSSCYCTNSFSHTLLCYCMCNLHFTLNVTAHYCTRCPRRGCNLTFHFT
jgi:hypothetical protein